MDAELGEAHDRAFKIHKSNICLHVISLLWFVLAIIAILGTMSFLYEMVVEISELTIEIANLVGNQTINSDDDS